MYKHPLYSLSSQQLFDYWLFMQLAISCENCLSVHLSWQLQNVHYQLAQINKEKGKPTGKSAGSSSSRWDMWELLQDCWKSSRFRPHEAGWMNECARLLSEQKRCYREEFKCQIYLNSTNFCLLQKILMLLHSLDAFSLVLRCENNCQKKDKPLDEQVCLLLYVQLKMLKRTLGK